jgi:hypothetical protein
VDAPCLIEIGSPDPFSSFHYSKKKKLQNHNSGFLPGEKELLGPLGAPLKAVFFLLTIV